MYLVDYHVHTKRCGHACGSDREYIETAIRRGLKEIGFSDHVPRFYEPSHSGSVTERGMSWAELEEYVTSITRFQAQYRDIQIKLGLEVDYVPGWEVETERIITQYPWDYILGSVHFISEWNYGYLPNEKDHPPEEIYPVYFERVAESAESRLFDVLTHIDLPKRGFKPLAEMVMTELYQKLAARLGKVQAVVELNTYGIRGSYTRKGEIYPAPELLQLCHDAGVRVTLGSDAHRPRDVGADFKQATQLMAQVGYKEILTFSQREGTMVEWEK